MAMDLSKERREYRHGELRRASLDGDPFRQFEKWFEEGRGSVREPNAMALATANGDGKPSVRMVLLKGFDGDGFRFGTNYQSRKGEELAENSQAALLFFWPDLERQVRIVGRVEKSSTEESDAIFMARPRLSRLAAISSQQSEPVESRGALESHFKSVEGETEGREVTRPEFWGAYRVVPVEFEFWQGRTNRLHDRFQYLPEGSGWSIIRLQP